MEKIKNKVTQGLASIRHNFSSSRSGSVLVYTLIILSMVLVIALGISAVTVVERKTSSATGKSVVAFQAADSCVEMVTQRIYDAARSDTVSNVFSSSNGFNGTCNPDGTISPNIDISGSKTCKVTLYDSTNESSRLSIGCNTTSAINNVRLIQSIGIYSSTTRAVETALADISNYKGCKITTSSTTGWKEISLTDSAGNNFCKDNPTLNGCTIRIIYNYSSSTPRINSYPFFQNSANIWVLGEGAAATGTQDTGQTDLLLNIGGNANIDLYDDNSANCTGSTADNLCLSNTSSPFVPVMVVVCD